MGVVVTVIAVLNPGNLGGSVTLGPVTVSAAALVAGSVMVLIGALAGYFVVPMNALLQHRGHVLLSAGHSIAVQNFNENLSILVMFPVRQSGQPDKTTPLGDGPVPMGRLRIANHVAKEPRLMF